MTSKKLAGSHAALIGAGIIAVGVRFLINPEASASGFGVPVHSAADAYLAVKGVRDLH